MHPEYDLKRTFQIPLFLLLRPIVPLSRSEEQTEVDFKVARIEVVKGVLKTQISAAVGYNAYEILQRIPTI
jgi:hypothetical protein